MKPPHLPLWTATTPFSLTPPLSPKPLQSIQGSLSFLYPLPHLLDTNGHAHYAYKMACRPFACSGARYSALPHCSCPLPTASGHLGPPQRARRDASTSATRQLVGPLLLLPPLASARTRAGRPSAPVSTLTRAVPWPPYFPSLLSPRPRPTPRAPQTCPRAPPWPPTTARSSPVHEPQCTSPPSI